MSISTWVETVPSGTSTVGSFPGWSHTMWGAVATGMAVEHYWPGSGGGSDASIGELAPGGSRAYFDVQSKSSAAGSQQTARLFFASDASRLFAYDSTGTYLVGTAFYGEYAPTADWVGSSTLSEFWVRQSGSYTTTDTSGTTDVTFPVSFTTTPYITQTVNGSGGAAQIFLGIVASGTSARAFRSAWSARAAPGSFTVAWEAIGNVSSASY
jgi:hypothetical protein